MYILRDNGGPADTGGDNDDAVDRDGSQESSKPRGRPIDPAAQRGSEDDDAQTRRDTPTTRGHKKRHQNRVTVKTYIHEAALRPSGNAAAVKRTEANSYDLAFHVDKKWQRYRLYNVQS